MLTDLTWIYPILYQLRDKFPGGLHKFPHHQAPTKIDRQAEPHPQMANMF